MTRITRVEVIDENGRSYVNWEDDNNVSWQFQDDGRTLKVFVNKVKPKSPVEEAYKDWMGEYPPTTPSVDNTDDIRWRAYQMGYNALQKSEKEQQMKELIRESKKWCEEHPDESVEDYLTPQGPQGPVGPGPGPKGVIVGYEPTPQTPEQVADGLKEAFRESVKQGVVSSTTKAQNLYDIICDCMVKYNSTVYPGLICDILDAVDEWLPKEQSAAGSQNAYVECSVEGFNDCINKIRRKLR